ncbi:MAG: PepSY domain-containing protein [Clostridiales bacterium]|nr:PepSY domain-containing protein [Clostridiales bacterium]
MKKLIITFILTLALTFCLCACGNGKVTDEDGFIGSDEEMNQASDNIKDDVNDVKDDVKDKAEDIGNDVKDGAEDIGNDVKDKAEDVGDDIKNGVEKGAEEAKDMGKNIIGDVKDDNNQLAEGNTETTNGSNQTGNSDQNDKSIGTAAEARLNLEEAKQAALSDAGQPAKEATFLKCYLENENGREYYAVEFNAAGSEYDYKIDAYTGRVIAKEQESLQ